MHISENKRNGNHLFCVLDILLCAGNVMIKVVSLLENMKESGMQSNSPVFWGDCLAKLSERMRLILAVLRIHGPQPVSNLIQIAYPGQRVFTSGQRNHFLASLRHLEENGLIKKVEEDPFNPVWKITEKGKNI